MPLNKRGLVRLRLSVWFSAASWCAKAAVSLANTSMPPGSIAASASRPSTTWIDARRLVPASVNSSVPAPKAKLASAPRAGVLAPVANQRRRPAIIR